MTILCRLKKHLGIIQMMKFRILYISLTMLLVSCSVGPAEYASHKSSEGNEAQRVEILSESAFLVTIRHNQSGEKKAMSYSFEKCKSIGRKSVYENTLRQYGSDIISTWKCVELGSL
ncbi:MAG: hypothetical protein KJ950_06255 [Proteobacteria bacterium]|nr:hypothetical protein [Pseudomonadota bacterium]MBU1688721.1 hypothetical protein [Pseudomonadota bacterium]